MKACTIVSLITAAVGVAAVPAIHEVEAPAKDIENITVKNLFLQKSNGNINHAGFQLSGRNATDLPCDVTNPVVKPFGQSPGVYSCVNADSMYRFSLMPGTSDYDITVHVYHELGTAFGFQGEGVVALNCHGVNSPDNQNCGQVSEASTFPIWFK
ncbi:hypothetical protein E4U21_002503 [Claviceps maximensis]|nr:hypothetical protein E4U21_002503 [Claviceps maximensis]